MADNTQLWTQFFQKVQSDEAILRARFPQIAAIGQGASVPAAVLQNYEIARQDVQQRMAFTRDLLRQYSDPKTGDSTPDPNWLPALGFSPTGLSGGGMTLADALDELKALPPMQLVSGRQIVISAPPPSSVTQVDAGDQLGNPIVVLAVIGALIVVTGITAKFIIDAANEKQVKLAQEAVQLARQKNFARIWDTAQGLLTQCVGPNPTPDLIASCWQTVAQRFPDIAKSIPDDTASGAGMGFFGKLTLAAAGVGVVVAGVWAYRKWGKRGGGGNEEAMVHHASRGRAASAHGTWMNGADLPMTRPEAPQKGYGFPPARKAPKRRAAGRK